MDGYNGVQWLATEDDTEASALRAEQDSLKFLGKADKYRGTMKRNANLVNPWNNVENKTMRRKRRVSSKEVQTLDAEARAAVWYCLDMAKENALAYLENRIDRLGNGAFVVCNSSKDFATLSFTWQKNLFNLPLDASDKGLFIRFFDIKSPKMFPTLTALIQYYGKKKQKGMPCKLDLVGLAIDVAEHDREREPAIVNPGYMSPGSEAGQPRERVDSLFTDAGGDARLQRGKSGAGATTVRSSIHNNPGYKGAGKTTTARSSGMTNGGYVDVPAYKKGETGLKPPQGNVALHPSMGDATDGGDGGYLTLTPAVNEPGDEGFITISRQPFNPKQGIKGVSFEPAQTDEWFFSGISNIQQNHHGKRDQHYDDIDYCLFFMGNAKATARENEEDVGPYIEYKASDTFQIKCNLKSSCVEYLHNGKKFHSSFLPEGKLPLWVSQAFHPVNGGQTLVKNSKWVM